jgi:hypothetical protein
MNGNPDGLRSLAEYSKLSSEREGTQTPTLCTRSHGKPHALDSHRFASRDRWMPRGLRRAQHALCHARSVTGCARLRRRRLHASVAANRSISTAMLRRLPLRQRKRRRLASNPIEFRICRCDQR